MEAEKANPAGERVERQHPSRSCRLARALRLGRIITSSTQPLDYEELASSLGVSRRTLYRDLSLLRSAGIESPYARTRRGYRTEPTGELLGRTLTIHEAAAILELLEQDHRPKPGSAYGRVLRDARQKVILALRGECSAMKAKLAAIISAYHGE